MASVFGTVRDSSLYRRNFLLRQMISKIRKYTSLKLSEELSDQPKEIVEIISPFLEENDLSHDLCLRIRNEMINKNVPEKAVDTRILDLCLKAKKFQIARAYIKCLESNGYSINIYTLGRYLQLYQTEVPLTKSEENDIINMVERIQKESEHMPPTIMKNCIIALCKTHKWKEAFQLIKKMPLRKEILNTIPSQVIPAAFRNEEISLGLTLLDELNDPQDDGHRHRNLYIEYLNYYLQKRPAELNEAVEKIFSFWRKYDIVPTKFIIDLFVNVCNNAGWVTEYVEIKRDGNCSHCGNHLTALAINDKTFEMLANDVISKTLIDTDIYHSTTPLELKKFKDFIKKTKPYDIVVDGLNVSSGQRNIPWLRYIIDYFSRHNKKILIVGRQHMYQSIKWVLPLKNVHTYFFADVTSDDPYILYATLISGNNAKFITYDLLRQHVHKLDNVEIRRLFKRWQYTHQYSWCYDDLSKKVFLTEPWLCNPFAQHNNGYWHIPYRMDTKINKSLPRPVETWICLRRPEN